jgi:hypothetical protein
LLNWSDIGQLPGIFDLGLLNYIFKHPIGFEQLQWGVISTQNKLSMDFLNE